MTQNNAAEPVAKEEKKKRKTRPKEGISAIKEGKRQLADIKKEIKKIDSEKKATNKKRNQFLKEIKAFGIKLESVLKKEAEIESRIEEIEKTEKTAPLKEKKGIEKKRWKIENKRRKIEKEKWSIQEKTKETENKIKIAESKEQELLKKKERLEEKRENISQKMEELARKRIQFLKRFLGEKADQIKSTEQKKQEEEIRKAEELKNQGEQERQKQFEEIKRIEELRIKQERARKDESQLLLPPGAEKTEIKETQKIISPVIKIESQNIELSGKPGFLTGVFNKTPVKADDSYKIKEKAIREQEKIKITEEGLPVTRIEESEKRPDKNEQGLEQQKIELIKHYERELEKQRQEMITRHREEMKQQEEKIVKEKYIPYVPEETARQKELIKQLEKEQEGLKLRHKQELEKQAEEIRQRQKEELKKQGQEWKIKQEKKEETREEDIRLFKERIRKRKENLEARRKLIEEEVERIRQEELIREELKRKREEPIPEEEIQLSEKQMEKRKEELELRRKAIEEEAKKIESEEQEREQSEKRKMEEKQKRGREETEKKKRAEMLSKEEKPAIKTAEKEKQLTEQEKKERERKEKELLPLFEQAVKHYKAKEFGKANELFFKLKEQAFEPEKEPKFFDKLLNKAPLYIRIEEYLRKIEKEKTIKAKREAKAVKKKERKKEKKEISKKEESEKKPSGSIVFNIFGRIKPTHPTIGIDISDHSIEILYLNRQKSILDYGRTTIREGIIRDGEIINQRELTEAFRLTSQQAGLKPFNPRKGMLSKAIVSLPESKTYIQVFNFDSRADLLKKVRAKIESTIPFPINDLYWSYIESWDQNTGKTKVLCTATLKDTVDSQAHFFRSSGINPIVFDIESASVGRALLSDQKTQGATVILDIGARTTNLSIFDKKLFLSFSLTVRCAGLDFINKIADYLSISQEKAETIMKEKGFKKEDNPFLPALEEEAGKIIKETQQSLDYYQGEFGENVEKIILAGGISLLPQINTFFQERFGKIKVELGNPLEKIKRKGGLKEEMAILYANVIGLALRAISKNPVRDGINLSPEEIKSREK